MSQIRSPRLAIRELALPAIIRISSLILSVSVPCDVQQQPFALRCSRSPALYLGTISTHRYASRGHAESRIALRYFGSRGHAQQSLPFDNKAGWPLRPVNSTCLLGRQNARALTPAPAGNARQ